MKKLLIFIISLGVLISAHTARALPTSTIVQNLFITDLKNNGVRCLQITDAGLVQTSTAACGTGSGSGGLATSSPWSADLIPIIVNGNTLTASSGLSYDSSLGELKLTG